MRSTQKELIDLGPSFYTASEYQDCLKKLFWVNRLFGFLRSLRNHLPRISPHSTVLDIGCGSGLTLLHLNQHFPHLKFTGIDLNPQAIEEAQRQLHRRLGKQALTSNVRFAVAQGNELEQPYDLILATLVCHHMTNEEIVTFLKHAYQAAKRGVIIQDLHRHWIARRLYQITSPLLFRNRLISHDGLISIARGFTRREWKILLQKAQIKNYKLKWALPFRWQIIFWKDEP